MSESTQKPSQVLYAIAIVSLQYVTRESCGGSSNAVQAWQTCFLWEPSPSHPILVLTRGFTVFCVYMYAYCAFMLIV